MRKFAIFCALLIGVVYNADAATARNPRGGTVATTGGTASTGTRSTTARSATTARAATATRGAAPAAATTARAATAGRTTVSRGPVATTSSSSSGSGVARSAVARAGATQKVISTGTKVATANENVVVSQECRQKYYGCMDSFCMLDNDNGGRCICSDRSAELDSILAQIEELDQQSYQMATYGVERIEMGDAAETAIANANAVAQAILDEQENGPLDLPDLTNVTDLNSWLMPVDVSDEDIFSNADIFQSPIDNKTGDALHQASYEICAQQMPECADEMDMLRLMYAQQIRSDCTAYENSLKQQRNASAQKLYTAEQALRSAALEQYQSANKYDLGQCVVEFKNCMIETGGCGSDFSGCASIAAFDSTNTRSTNRDLSNTYTIKGSATSIEIQASTYDILLSKKPLCEGITRQCQNVASQVWDTFLREVAPQVKSAELIAEDNARQNCIGNISSCFQQACKDTMDPNDPDGSYDMCLTRPETMLNLCKVPLNACGISEESAPESDIWDFILARLASMRVNSCTTQFKDCLQSEDRCGPDYTQCIGLDTDTIVRMCPYDTLVGCQQKYGETDIRDDAVYDELYNIAQGIFLNIDNNMLTQCQKIADEAMIKVCGDTDNCLGLTVDENLGSRSLEYKICEYSGENDSMDINYANCRTDVSQITDDELGRSPGIDPATGEQIPGTIKPLAGVIDGVIYWESVEINEDGRLISVDEYLDKIGEADAPENQREMISSELAVLQRNIDTAINAIESDPNVQYCMNGREVDGIETIVDRAGNTGQVRGRFPALTTQMRMIIANAALKAAKDNYYAKYDELTERLQQDYVTIGERIAEIHGENAKDARREMAREACVNFAELSSLPKSAEPPKSAGGAIVATLALAAAAIAAPFTAGLSVGAVLATVITTTSLGLAAVGAGVAGYAGGGANGADGAGQLDLTGSKSVNQWNYKETITTTFDWENLVCHKCTRTQQCTKTGNPLFGNKYCKTWADPVETCSDTQF